MTHWMTELKIHVDSVPIHVRNTYVDILLLHNHFLCVLLHFPPTQPLPSVTITAVTLNFEAVAVAKRNVRLSKDRPASFQWSFQLSKEFPGKVCNDYGICV